MFLHPSVELLHTWYPDVLSWASDRDPILTRDILAADLISFVLLSKVNSLMMRVPSDFNNDIVFTPVLKG
jgi:hypothetical protein